MKFLTTTELLKAAIQDAERSTEDQKAVVRELLRQAFLVPAEQRLLDSIPNTTRRPN